MFSPQLRQTAHKLLKIQTHVYAVFDRRKYALLNLCYSDRDEGQGPFDLGSGAKLTEVETSYTGQYLRPMLEKGK